MIAPKFNCILLVDDDDATNYLHQMVIEEVGCCEKIAVAGDGEQALRFLQAEACEDEDPAVPELILLDINMPWMDGWEFLEAYQALPEEKRGAQLVVMLTTSLNRDDRARAEAAPEVADFLIKPLTEESLAALLRKHWPTRIAETIQ